MGLQRPPEINAGGLPDTCAFLPDEKALDAWNAGLRAEQMPENTITLLDVIGYDPWTGEGVTSKRVAAALRSIGDGEVFVDINSPGGSVFEGVAIYNLLRGHRGKVTVRIIGMAASIASVIAMAGDKIEIGETGFMMVHNAMTLTAGNQTDHADAIKRLALIDAAMVAAYAHRSEKTEKTVKKWLNEETWFSGEQAVAAGLADGYLSADIGEDKELGNSVAALKPAAKVEAALRRAGKSRSESRSLISELMGPSVVAMAKRQAKADDDDDEIKAALLRLCETIKS